MNILGNCLWLIFGGLLMALVWVFIGLILCVSFIGIPFGIQCFKIAIFLLAPFGRDVEVGYFGAGGLLLNIIWIILFGWELMLGHLAIGAVFCLTIVGIPFGLQHFKFAKLGFIPFGARID